MIGIRDGFMVLDQDWHIVLVNWLAPEDGSSVGRKSEDLTGKVFWEAYPELTGTALYGHFQTALQTGRPVSFLYGGEAISVHPAPEGISVYWKEKEAERPRFDANPACAGAPGNTDRSIEQSIANTQAIARKAGALLARIQSNTGSIGTHLDEGRKLKAQLQEMVRELSNREARFQLALRTISEGFWDWDMITNQVWWNEAYDRLYGPRPPDSRSCPGWWEEHLHPDDRESVLRCREEALNGGEERWVCEYRFRRGDGSYGYVRDQALITRDPQGRAIRLTGAMLDLTDLKQKELSLLASQAELRANSEALRRTEERFRVALSNTATAVFSTDRDLRYNWFYSPALSEFPWQFIGKRDDEILPAEEVSELLALKQRVLESGVSARQEIRLRVPDSEWVLIASVEPTFDGDGRPDGVIGAYQDVTEQRRLEAQQFENATEMEVQRRLLEHREMERQQIARDIHDGPLQSVSALAFAMRVIQDTSTESKVKELARPVGEGLKNLAGELREVCNELRPPLLSKFGLKKAIRAHAAEMMNKHPEIGLVLQITGDQEMATDAACSDSAALALFRIYQEALNNVARHSQASEVTIRLNVEPGRALLEIRDNGIGFPASFDWVSLAREGHFGLIGMKERAEAAGGKFKVASAPGKGVTIQVEVKPIVQTEVKAQ